MRLLYICRLFSGLADGVRAHRWEPRGVPTVYRLIEALDRSNHDLRLVFTVKDDAVGWPGRQIETFDIAGLSCPVTVVPQGIPPLPFAGRARGYLREARQFLAIRRMIDEHAPDLVYFDRVNIYAAALTARRGNVPVVWRVMGVPPSMHDILDASGPVAAYTRHAYRAPFATVICTRDGSGGDPWMTRALAPDTPRQMMINGVDPVSDLPLPPAIAGSITGAGAGTKVLFVARLVEDKGCLSFVDAICESLDRVPQGFTAVIAGSGPFEAPMRERAAERGYGDRFIFLGQVAHREVLALHRHCDIYVSLNSMCNLTNANLEAMKAGVCMIIPASPGIRGIDVDTDALMPPDLVWRIASPDDIAGLSDALVRLHGNPGERHRRAAATAARAQAVIPDWRTRIDNEIALLEQIAAGRNR